MKHTIFSLAILGFSFASVQTYAQDYPIVFDKSQNYTHASRRLNSVSLKSSDGMQTRQLPTPLKVYSMIENETLSAKAGETVTSSFGFSGTWMNGFVYLDRQQDGVFDATLNADGTIPEGSDIMAFSYAEPVLESGEGYNSKGERVTNSNVLNPPSFVVPAELKPGFYMMRYKVDWASIDPAGRKEDGNGILRNGGAICDIALNIHENEGALNVVAEHGTLTMHDGSALPGTIAFGQSLTVNVVPAEGYALDVLRLRHGHNLDGAETVHGVTQYRTIEIPAYLMKGQQITIPAAYVDGDVHLDAVFVEKANTEATSDYAVSFEKDTPLANAYEGKMTLTVDGKKHTVVTNSTTAYADLTNTHCSLYAPQQIKVSVTDNREGLNYYLYIDYNNDGAFTPLFTAEGEPTVSSELVAVAESGKTLPTFTLPELLPEGVYRMRLKADVNNVSASGSSDLVQNGGVVVDALLNIIRTEKKLRLHTTNGNIYAPNHGALPYVITPLSEDLTMVPSPVVSGYMLDGDVVVKHGHNLNGEQFLNGNMQWQETKLEVVDGKATLPATCLNGDVEVYANFVAGDDCEWELVFSDEFNGADYTQPTSEKWMRCQRYGATWNRWLSDSKEVIYEQGGDLVARAIPNPDTSTDNVPMITGGIKSMGKFGFTYGVVEGRIFSNLWVGNFPAFWMMPEDQSAGWPDCGEIDIWETIDEQSRSWHTVHSNWTYDLGKTGDPVSSFNVPVDYSRYHTFRLEWNNKTLIWFVDGKEVGRYARSTKTSNINQGQWPFNKHFHLILNQSVGNGAWAAHADVAHTYETRFDWVRVYQKRGMKNTNETVGIQDCETDNDSLYIDAPKGGLTISASSEQNVTIYNVSGVKVFGGVLEGDHHFNLPAGVYIVAGKKFVVG